MGVDWYSCKHCGETFPDCGDYVWCECGKHWCSYECAEADGYENVVVEVQRMEMDEEISCNFCRKEDFGDRELLNFALKVLNVSREELVKMFKENK